MLAFDRRELVLPIVPVNTASNATLHVINHGYETMQVRFRMPVDSARIPLQLAFKEGDIISVTKPRLPVEVRSRHQT